MIKSFDFLPTPVFDSLGLALNVEPRKNQLIAVLTRVSRNMKKMLQEHVAKQWTEFDFKHLNKEKCQRAVTWMATFATQAEKLTLCNGWSEDGKCDISKLKNLTHLVLPFNRITDVTAIGIAELTKLKFLFLRQDINGTILTEVGVRAITRNLTNLEELDLSYATKVSQAAFTTIGNRTTLKALHLNGISSGGINVANLLAAILPKLTRLERLHIGVNQINLRQLTPILESNRTIHSLDLRDTIVPSRVIPRLVEKFTNLSVTTQNEDSLRFTFHYHNKVLLAVLRDS